MDSQQTLDHEIIRNWAEEREGKPAIVEKPEDTSSGDGILRIAFTDESDKLHEISWGEFFQTFDEENLTFVYQDRTPEGEVSMYGKLVPRDSDADN